MPRAFGAASCAPPRKIISSDADGLVEEVVPAGTQVEPKRNASEQRNGCRRDVVSDRDVLTGFEAYGL